MLSETKVMKSSPVLVKLEIPGEQNKHHSWCMGILLHVKALYGQLFNWYSQKNNLTIKKRYRIIRKKALKK